MDCRGWQRFPQSNYDRSLEAQEMRFRGILNDVYGQVLHACASWGFNFKIRIHVQHEGAPVQHVFIFLYGRITKNIRPYYERITNVYIVIMRSQCELYANALRTLCERNTNAFNLNFFQ